MAKTAGMILAQRTELATAIQEAGRFELLNVAETDGDGTTLSAVRARCSAWCGEELDYRSPYLDDEPVRLALAVDL